MKIKLGFSTCPNDTFMFDALVNGRIDTKGFEFEPHLADVEELNSMAFQDKLDVTKLSYYTLMKCADKYTAFESGSALGRGCGPLLVSSNPSLLGKSIPENINVAIPGENTTAHFLFNLFYPELYRKSFMLFSDVENAVLMNKCDAGVIIHESRFTYMDKGLVKLDDLGERWEKAYDLPIPLGCIAASKRLGEDVVNTLDVLVKNSILHAMEYPEDSVDYVRQHAVEMNESVMKQHIGLYVNDFSLGLGEDGKNAVSKMSELIGLHSISRKI